MVEDSAEECIVVDLDGVTSCWELSKRLVDLVVRLTNTIDIVDIVVTQVFGWRVHRCTRSTTTP